ncbi:MAG: ABC transporter substrate-binding protein [Proteobacteria bacterium]|nr:ABC transporter substrate-binding protein [Pseudomonadota bacterium]
MRNGWWKALLLACMIALISAPAFAKTIKIACASPFTGPAASYGDNVKAGVEMKVDEINAAGGINGAQIEVVWMDELCDPKEAATVATKIVRDDEIVGIVGHLCSSAHLAALPTYVRKGIVAISPTATNVTISDLNKDREKRVWSFRDVYRDDYQGQFLAKYASKGLGLKKVAVFYENNDYGIGLKDAFVGEAKALGMEVVGVEAYVKGTTDFTPQLTKLKGAAPEGLFISGYYNEGALIASQAKKIGLDVIKFGADGLDNADYINLSGDASENTYLTTPFLADAANDIGKKFIVDFTKRYQRDVDYMSVNAYDAAGILLQAIEKAGTDRTKVRDYMAGMTTPEKGYVGASGLTYFNEHGDAQKSAFVKMVKGGKFVTADKQL